MPPTPLSTRKPTQPRRSATHDPSFDDGPTRTSGLYQANTIQDRIRQWQAQGAGAAPAPDTVSVYSAPRSEISVTPFRSRSPSPLRKNDSRDDKQLNTSPDGPTSGRWVDVDQREWIRKGRASTPRKRLISDEHWKITNSKSHAHTHVEHKEKKPIEKAFLETILPNKDVDRTILKARAEREERRRRRKEARSVKAETTKQEGESGSRNRRKSPLRYEAMEQTILSVNVEAQSNRDTVTELPIAGDVDYPSVDENGYYTNEDDRPSRQKSKYAATLGQPPQYGVDTSIRSRKGSIMNKTKEILGMAETPRVIPNRLPSIEAWLDDQPDDPFVTRAPELDTVHEEIAKPTRKRSIQPKVHKHTPRKDPNRIWDLIENAGPDHTSNNESSVLPDFQSPQQNSDVINSSPTTLKRQGARLSRPKRYTESEVLLQNGPHAHLDEQHVSTDDLVARQNRDCHIRQEPTHLPHTTPVKTVQPLPLPPPYEEDGIQSSTCNLKRKLTTHADMLTELSKTKSCRSMRKPRSVRITNTKSSLNTSQDILDSMKQDEAKYGRELRTLVDGVIPVLLQSVLSKNDAFAAADLFTHTGNAKDDIGFARPIIDMGIALERLKSLHNRIPLQNIDSLLSWCQTAHKAYSDYLTAWRLGFHDIIVNLAPLENSQDDNCDIMERDINGDVVNADGEKVDVAFLLKRPLVRIRKFGKDLSCLKDELQGYPLAAKVAETYVELTDQAKRKHSQEQGRLEDETAARIDSTKTRDIRTMAPMTQVKIDKHRTVRARDMFDMSLYHTSGQRMDCRIEIVLRDNQPGLPAGGDVLICGLEESGAKWLLFAPVEIGHISARRGESGHDLVVMIRGHADLRSDWYEMLALKADVPEAAAEWMNMLGSNPLPPKLSRVPTFLEIKAAEHISQAEDQDESREPVSSKIPSIEAVDIPIGEPSTVGTLEPYQVRSQGIKRKSIATKPVAKLSLGGGLQQKAVPDHWQARDSMLHRKLALSVQSSDRSTISGQSGISQQLSITDSQASTRLSFASQSRQNNAGTAYIQPSLSHTQKLSSPVKSEHIASNQARYDQESRKSTPKHTSQSRSDRYDSEPLVPSKDRLEEFHDQQILSAAPSEVLPSMPKIRVASTNSSVSSTPLTDSMQERWSAFSGRGKRLTRPTSLPIAKQEPMGPEFSADMQASLPKQSNRFSTSSAQNVVEHSRSDAALTSKDKATFERRNEMIPAYEPSSQVSEQSKKRLSSSPLKHQYAPSVSSASTEDYDSNEGSSDDSSSDTSEDLGSELKDEAKSLPDMTYHKGRLPKVFSGRQSVPTAGTRTLAPSDSASQGPYRRALPASAFPSDSKKRALATVCSWSDTAMWQPIREDECAIVISPGLVEVFPVSSLQAKSQIDDEQPLVAFELTPLVQLRQGTAVDITIRSPPTANSQIKTSNNTMFRSRTVADSDKLYGYINWARCNNLTYIELERSRPRPQPAVTFSNQQSERPKSWFSFGGGPQRRNSYRAGSMPPPSMQESIASAGSVSNALSALKRLSRTSAFSVNRSSVVRRPGLSAPRSLYSSGAETTTISGSGSSTPAPATQIGHIPGKEGPSVPQTSAAAVEGAGMINNMKIKFFVRNGQDWRLMGWGRLSVLPAPVPSPSASRPGSSSSTPPGTAAPSRRNSALIVGLPGQRREYRLPSSSHTPHRIHGNGREKRIVVTKNKKPDKVFLDAILGEACFEKIAERGIAMKVWKEEQQIAHRGGVMTGRGTMYMMQFDSSSEASWVFGLCGTYRYAFNEAQ